jgi:hypothetical protein
MSNKRIVAFKELPQKFKDVLANHKFRKDVTVRIGTEHEYPPQISDHACMTFHVFMPNGEVRTESGGYGGYNMFNSRTKAGMINRGSRKPVPLPPNTQVLVHNTGWKTSSATLYIRPEDVTPMLPSTLPGLTWAMIVVLLATRTLKSSYAGIKDYRKHEACKSTGITPPEYDKAQEQCMQLGYLRKNKSINAAGKNAILNLQAGYSLSSLRRADD